MRVGGGEGSKRPRYVLLLFSKFRSTTKPKKRYVTGGRGSEAGDFRVIQFFEARLGLVQRCRVVLVERMVIPRR